MGVRPLAFKNILAKKVLMDPSKLYVPDPQKWVQFYKHLADGKIKHYSYNQSGGGNTAHSFITPVDFNEHQNQSEHSQTPPVKLVSTSQQIVNQAKSELQREGESIKDIKEAVHPQKQKRRRKGNISKSMLQRKVKKQKKTVRRKFSDKALNRKKKRQRGGGRRPKTATGKKGHRTSHSFKRKRSNKRQTSKGRDIFDF